MYYFNFVKMNCLVFEFLLILIYYILINSSICQQPIIEKNVSLLRNLRLTFASLSERVQKRYPLSWKLINSKKITMISQYNIIITPLVQEKIEKYTLGIREYYLILFSEIGLWEREQVMKSQYIEWSDILNQSIITSIRDIFNSETISHSLKKDNQYEAYFSMVNCNICLTYEKDQSKIYITDIEILKT